MQTPILTRYLGVSKKNGGFPQQTHGFPTKNDHDLGCEMGVFPPFKETPIWKTRVLFKKIAKLPQPAGLPESTPKKQLILRKKRAPKNSRKKLAKEDAWICLVLVGNWVL